MCFRQTNGHPLFTLELLRGLQERGDLAKDTDNKWIESPHLDWDNIPARVEAVINERVERLPSALQRILRIASIEGEVFTAEAIALALDIPTEELLHHLNEDLGRKHRLIRAHSIHRVGGKLVSNYHFQHIQIQKYLYSTLTDIERVHLHEKIGTILERIYSAEEVTAERAAHPSVVTPVLKLARHFLQAEMPSKAVHYLHISGERAVQLSAYQEASSHLDQALDVLMIQPESEERNRKELALQLSRGKAKRGATSMAFPEVEQIYLRARDLCQQVGSDFQMCLIQGELAIVHYVRAEPGQARAYAEKSLETAKKIQSPILTAMGDWLMGVTLFGLGEFTLSRRHIAKVLDFYRPEEHFSQFVYLRGVDAGLSAQAYDASCLLCLGYLDQAVKVSQSVIAEANLVNHPFTLADVLTYGGCIFNEMRGETELVLTYANQLIELSDLIGLSWRGSGIRSRGAALALLGKLEEGLAEIRYGMDFDLALAAECNLSGVLGNLAVAYAQAERYEEGLQTAQEALDLINKKEEQYITAEIYRIRGDILAAKQDVSAAEKDYLEAISVAKKQEAKFWELKAVTSLAQLWHQQGKTEEAKQILSEVYDWFTEGFEHKDMKAARLLLNELST
jgi:predicted ATPase